MRTKKDYSKIEIKDGLSIKIYPEGAAYLYEISDFDTEEFGEAKIQLLEGKRYEYVLSNSNYKLKSNHGKIVIPSNRKDVSSGVISPNVFVGTLELYVYNDSNNKEYTINVEVLATKFNSDLDNSYRSNYRTMLESITSKCTELLMQANSPIKQNFESDFNRDAATIYQRFSFVKSIINSQEFEEAILKIITSPKTVWEDKEELVDIRSVKRFSNKNVKELLRNTNRIPLRSDHALYSGKLKSLPSKINSYKKEEIVDNLENRFIKHALETYLYFCEECDRKFGENSREKKEAKHLINILESHLSHSFFKKISRANTLNLNSPTLQRKSGYREVLKSWLMFDLASKLVWKGGDDVYNAGKRDIATLYEYWLFFVLYDLFKSKFGLNKLEQDGKEYKHLIEKTKNELNLIVKSGEHTALSGEFDYGNRMLNIKYSFNRTFSSSAKEYSYPEKGSWTKPMRPDYTLTIWPYGKSEDEAEKEELIVHIHFDAKYKVKQFFIDKDEDLNNEKQEERKGNFKNVDLLKMHAYKDAIRRTSGAYILYPGTEVKQYRGFHELIPGLGAFAINPGKETENTNELSSFIDEVIQHLSDRASQRENIANKTYKVYDVNKGKEHEMLHEQIPEYIGEEKIIPDETYVLIGYYKSQEHFDWILKNKYNYRTGLKRGSFPITENEVGAKYILLHGEGETITGKIYELSNDGILIFSKQDLIDKDYPTHPSGDLYLMYRIVKNVSPQFNNVKFDLNKLDKFKSYRSSPKPLTVTLSELMRCKEY